MSTADLFDDTAPGGTESLGPQACVLRGFALPFVDALLPSIDRVAQAAPFRHMVVPGGRAMSVALTNCGALGWTSDRRGYRYSATDPDSGLPWPAMPHVLAQLAHAAAQRAGFDGFSPEACLVNRYLPGARLALHQDRDERDVDAPIVSVSLGMRATFLFGGLARTEPAARVALHHGDVVVWGGVDRLRFHGVLPLRGAPHALLGGQRINCTLRKAG